MTSARPTVFIVEKSEIYRNEYEEKLKPQVTIVSVRSLAEAFERWTNVATEVTVIVMAGCVDRSGYVDTEELLREIRKTFNGPIIAGDSSVFQNILMQIGCDHQASKAQVPNKVLEVLGLTASTE